MTRQIGFLFNPNNCVGCLACEVKCQVYHNLDPEYTWRKVDTYKAHEQSREFEQYYSHSCHHCKKAACLEVCPVGAYTKDEFGAVVQDHEKCIGCGYCIVACPYHSISKGKDKKAQKCNLCAEKLRRNEEPACVQGCPCSALQIVDVETSDSLKMDKEMQGYKQSFTEPSTRIYPKNVKENYILP